MKLDIVVRLTGNDGFDLGYGVISAFARALAVCSVIALFWHEVAGDCLLPKRLRELTGSHYARAEVSATSTGKT